MASNAKTHSSLALTLLVGLLAMGSLSLPPLALVQRADRMVYDLWSRVAPPHAPDDIVIVTLDESTRYQTLARLADEQNARLLISTLVQPPSEEVGRNTLGPTATAPVGSPLLRETGWDRGGYLWREPDFDGVIRHERPLISDRAPVPSLALASSIALQRAAQSEMPGHEVIAYTKPLTVDDGGRRWIRYFDRSSFHRLSPSQLLETPVDLAGKVVIAGQNDSESYSTPIGTLSTQELLAHEVAGYWLDSAITTQSENYAVAWSLAGLLLLAVAALPIGLAWITALPIVGAGALVAGSASAFITNGTWYPIAGPILLALLGGGYGAWTRRQRPQSESESESDSPSTPRLDKVEQASANILEPAAKSDAKPAVQTGPPTALGRYHLIKKIGRGAMGLVYLGRDPKINRMVAIKTIDLAKEFDVEDIGEVRDRFLREAEAAGGLSHPNIVTIFDAGEENNIAYIAMELLRGTHLNGYTKPERLLPPATTLELMAQAAKALDYAHRHKVVHRDIKPANIMYDSTSDTMKLTDFGIARLSDVSRTRTGIVLGTPSFMSPEQLEGENVNGHTDLFALGVSLYQLLTGHLPFRGSSMTELMFVIANEPHRPVTAIRTDLPNSINAVLDKALAKKPANRFSTGAEMAYALREIAVQAG